MSLWWLSFADPNRSRGDEFVGVAIIEAVDFSSAIKAAWTLGCNPGGEVQGTQVDPKQARRLTFELPAGRLLQPDEARELAERVSAELSS